MRLRRTPVEIPLNNYAILPYLAATIATAIAATTAVTTAIATTTTIAATTATAVVVATTAAADNDDQDNDPQTATAATEPIVKAPHLKYLLYEI